MIQDSVVYPHSAVLPTDKIYWALDNLAIGEQSLICHGWVYVQEELLQGVELWATRADGQREIIRLQYGLSRPDVAEARGLQNRECGFFYHGGMHTQYATRLQLAFLIRNTQHSSCAGILTKTVDLPVAKGAEPGPQSVSLSAVRQRQLKNAVHMLLQRRWRELLAALLRRWRHSRTPKLDENQVQDFLVNIRPNSFLVIDHSLGGGANQYRNSLLHEWLLPRGDVIVWTFVPAILQNQMLVYRQDGVVEQFSVPSSAISLLLEREDVVELWFNNCVSFPQPERLVGLIAATVRRRSLKLTVLLHDFHSVCPSHFLLNSTKTFCNVPPLAKCRECLPKLDDQLASLFLTRDIDTWRAIWLEMLTCASEIRCFSNSSRDILLRAYPSLASAPVTVIPHQVHALPGQFVYPTKPNGSEDLRIAVVGSISDAKGREVVMALARLVQRDSLPLQIVVIGEVVGGEGDVTLVQTGRYQRSQLASLLALHKVHLALMPSIVAETFSYVTHELMQLGIPIACFSLGAQAEVISAYPLGRVISYGSSPEFLARELMAFKSTLDDRLVLKTTNQI